MRNLIILLATSAALASCVTAQPSVPGVKQVPANYRAVTASLIRSSLKDPYSVRDARISGVVPLSGVLAGNGQGVCVEFNAKNSFGAYTGVERHTVMFRNGAASSIQDGTCDDGDYGPFPELSSN